MLYGTACDCVMGQRNTRLHSTISAFPRRCTVDAVRDCRMRAHDLIGRSAWHRRTQFTRAVCRPLKRRCTRSPRGSAEILGLVLCTHILANYYCKLHCFPIVTGQSLNTHTSSRHVEISALLLILLVPVVSEKYTVKIARSTSGW